MSQAERQIRQRQYRRIMDDFVDSAFTEAVTFECIPEAEFTPDHELEVCGKHLVRYDIARGEFWPGDYKLDDDVPVCTPAEHAKSFVEALIAQAQIDMDGEYYVMPVPLSWVQEGRKS